MSVYGLYLSQMLQIRWRRWLTSRYLDAWLGERAYYQLELGGRTDNPDQRIAEDLQPIYYLCLESLDRADQFGGLLDFISGYPVGIIGTGRYRLGHWAPCIFPPIWSGLRLLYAGIGTWLTIKIGRPLSALKLCPSAF